MIPAIESKSKLTDRYQTTVPSSVRSALGLKKRDEIEYQILPDGEVRLRRAKDANQDDPVLGSFLEFLEKDMREAPEHIQAVDSRLLAKMQELTQDVEIDLNEPLADDDE